MMTNRTKIIAHRGASAAAAENTLSAFRIAAELCADGIELDVRQTADNVIVVAHDERIDRVSDGTGLIREYTYAELCEFNFAHKTGGHEKIPTLTEVFELIKPTPLMINIEIKPVSKSENIEQAVLCETQKHGMLDRVLFSSFDHYSMKRMKKLDASVRVGLLYQDILFKPWRYAKDIGATALHPRYSMLMIPRMVKKFHEHGMEAFAWTVDDERAMRLLIKQGVDAIITNQVEKALLVRERI